MEKSDEPIVTVEKRERVQHEDTERTPGWLRDYVDEDFNITFEPENELAEPLDQPWQGFSFAHPPHAEAQMWCEKAAREARRGAWSVLLLPAVFNSVYWRQVVYPNATEVRVFTCPIKMPTAKKQIVSQMCFVVFAGTAEREADYPYPVMYPMEPTGWERHYYKRRRNLQRFTEA